MLTHTHINNSLGVMFREFYFDPFYRIFIVSHVQVDFTRKNILLSDSLMIQKLRLKFFRDFN
jgi:hypothetical protein